MDNGLPEILTPEEALAIQVLSEALVNDVNNRVSRLIKRLGLKRDLKIFSISITGFAMDLEVQDEYKEMVKNRVQNMKIKTDDSPDYMV